jgi:hypothetical protein
MNDKDQEESIKIKTVAMSMLQVGVVGRKQGNDEIKCLETCEHIQEARDTLHGKLRCIVPTKRPEGKSDAETSLASLRGTNINGSRQRVDALESLFVRECSYKTHTPTHVLTNNIPLVPLSCARMSAGMANRLSGKPKFIGVTDGWRSRDPREHLTGENPSLH